MSPSELNAALDASNHEDRFWPKSGSPGMSAIPSLSG